MKNLEATKLAREALKAGGCGPTMYTNKYKTMRTVKAYGGGTPKQKKKILEALAKAFGDNAPEVDFNTYRPYPWRPSYKQSVVIVRFPYAEGEVEAMKVEEAIRKAAAKRNRLERNIASCKDSIKWMTADLRAEKAELKKLEAELEALG